MIIGVDAGALAVLDVRLKVGVYRVTLGLLHALSQIDKTNTYRLYTFRPIAPSIMRRLGSRMENRVISPSFGWMTLQVPRELFFHPVDVFLGLSQALPVTKSPSIGFLYDIGYLTHPQYYVGSAQRLERQSAELVKRADRIVTISESSKNAIAECYRIPQTRITVACPGIEPVFTYSGKKHTHKNPYILFVGSLKRGKNIPTLLRAFAEILDKTNKSLDLVIVGGDSWLDPDIEREVAKYALASHVHFPGFISDHELASYYRGALVSVFPSYVEGFCLPSVEAQQCGSPVIMSDTPVGREVIGTSGILVDPKDIHGLVKAVSDVIRSRALQKSLTVLGRENAEFYAWKSSAKKILDLIYAI